jgi:GTP-binding protein
MLSIRIFITALWYCAPGSLAFSISIRTAILSRTTTTTTRTRTTSDEPFSFPLRRRKHQSWLGIGSNMEDGSDQESISAASASTSTSTITTPSSSMAGSEGDYSFFDEASIYVRAGSGGQGASTFKRAKKGADGIPDGGTGGIGGNIVMILDDSLNTLAGLSRRALRPNAFGGGGAAASSKRLGHASRNDRLLSFRAADGGPGGRMYDNGRGGLDQVVRVPPGTVVSIEREILDADDENQDKETIDNVAKEESEEPVESDGDGEVVEGKEDATAPIIDNQYHSVQELGTVSFEQPTLIVARGGCGGEGTGVLKARKQGAARKGPQGGERHRLRLTLKIVADVAIVGVPNAGKSTFLAAVTRAEPRIADYPFTTVVPNLGVWIPAASGHDTRKSESNTRGGDRTAGSTGLVLCDVPGLIAGAADGVGLGHAFLRHVERCRIILHLVDGTSQDPVGDFKMVNDELRRYGTGGLAEMPQVVVVNKIDTWEEQGLDEENRLKTILDEQLKSEMGHTRLMWVSAKERDGMDGLMTRMASFVNNMKKTEENEVIQ